MVYVRSICSQKELGCRQQTVGVEVFRVKRTVYSVEDTPATATSYLMVKRTSLLQSIKLIRPLLHQQ